MLLHADAPPLDIPLVLHFFLCCQDIRLAGLQREVEGLRTDLDKVKSELR